MRLTIKAKNGAVADKVREYAEKKVKKLERFFGSVQSATMEQSAERGQHILEFSLEGDGVHLRSEERCADPYAAVDAVVDKMERQVKRFKTRRIRGHQRPGPFKEAAAEHAGGFPAGEITIDDEPFEPQIVRRKRFTLHPMPAEEAAHRMELVGHVFYLFQNEDTGQVNVLYRRRDGSYGLIEPER